MAAVVHDRADHIGDGPRLDLAECKIVADSKMPLGMNGNGSATPDLADPPLHVVRIGADDSYPLRVSCPLRVRQPDRVEASQGRRRRWNAGPGDNHRAEVLVALDAKPARGGAIPGDGPDFGVGKKVRSGQHMARIELIERGRVKRDLRDAQPRKMRGDIGPAREHGNGDRLEHRIGRWRDHADAPPHQAISLRRLGIGFH
jgi:hypothetical protein